MTTFYSHSLKLFSRCLCTLVLCAASWVSAAQGVGAVDFISPFEGVFGPISSGQVWIRVYDNGGTEITSNCRVAMEFSAKPGCGGTLTASARYPFGSTIADPVKITIGQSPQISIGVYYYRLKITNRTDNQFIYTQYFRVAIRKADNTPPVVTVNRPLIDTVRAETARTIPVLNLTGSVTDDCADSLKVFWQKASGPSVVMTDDFKGGLKVEDLQEGEYIFQLVAEDDDKLIRYGETKVIVRPPPPPPPPSVLTHMKAFSPNDDTIDDRWRITGISGTKDVGHVLVINQFGQAVESLRPPFIQDEVWDGTQFGKPLPEGAYYFIVRDKSDQEIHRGSVLLVR